MFARLNKITTHHKGAPTIISLGVYHKYKGRKSTCNNTHRLLSLRSPNTCPPLPDSSLKSPLTSNILDILQEEDLTKLVSLLCIHYQVTDRSEIFSSPGTFLHVPLVRETCLHSTNILYLNTSQSRPQCHHDKFSPAHDFNYTLLTSTWI